MKEPKIIIDNFSLLQSNKYPPIDKSAATKRSGCAIGIQAIKGLKSIKKKTVRIE
jgi:hypothetical protein